MDHGKTREMIGAVYEALQFFFQQYTGQNAAEHLYLVGDINETLATIAAEIAGLEAPPVLREEAYRDSTIDDRAVAELEAAAQWLHLALALCPRQLPVYGFGVDARFQKIMRELESLTVQRLRDRLVESYRALPKQMQTELEEYFGRFSFWGSLDGAAGDYTVLENRARALVEHREDFLWLYGRLMDYRSRSTLYAFVNNWYAFDVGTLGAVVDTLYKDYFDADVFRCDENEVLVDLGAFIGDSISDYVGTYGRFRKAYCYEITPGTFQKLQLNLRALANVVYRQKGASDRAGVMYIDEGHDASANILTERGSLEVPTVAIDDDIDEPVTFIKMDIEGAEQRAVLGCRRHIQNDRPKLAISVYHNNEDVWKIPRMIDEISPGYSFYLRYHGGNLSPSELSLLAVPPAVSGDRPQ